MAQWRIDPSGTERRLAAAWGAFSGFFKRENDFFRLLGTSRRIQAPPVATRSPFSQQRQSEFLPRKVEGVSASINCPTGKTPRAGLPQQPDIA